MDAIPFMANLASKAPARSFFGWALRIPLGLVPRSAVVRVRFGINRGMRWIAGAALGNCHWLGFYEADHAAVLQRVVKPGMIAFDVGANVGFYTLALSRLVGETGHVYAFEPEAKNVSILRRHIALNELRNVTVVQAAVSNRTGLVEFEGGGVLGRIGSNSEYMVPAITLNDFVASGNPMPSFLKMDIEGAESLALEGASTLFEKGQCIMMLATHGADVKQSCVDTVQRSGYDVTNFEFAGFPETNADFLIVPKSSQWQALKA
jgi:FkbM family methyltransferase